VNASDDGNRTDQQARISTRGLSDNPTGACELNFFLKNTVTRSTINWKFVLVENRSGYGSRARIALCSFRDDRLGVKDGFGDGQMAIKNPNAFIGVMLRRCELKDVQTVTASLVGRLWLEGCS